MEREKQRETDTEQDPFTGEGRQAGDGGAHGHSQRRCRQGQLHPRMQREAPSHAAPLRPVDQSVISTGALGVSRVLVEAIRETGIGPRYGVETHKEQDGGYTVGTEDTETEHCVRVTLTPDTEPPVVIPGTEDLPPPGPDVLAFYVSHATFSEGACR
ncbi:hypothetical protein [Streptomyces sp. NPDC093105]|uniref:hypothetical protein n=1 Tax=Streptomyces sp. NPDC093105 TaxID=3366029 RepID=UPI0037F4E438